MKKSPVLCVVIVARELCYDTCLQALKNIDCVIKWVTNHYFVEIVRFYKILRIKTFPSISVQFKKLSCGSAF